MPQEITTWYIIPAVKREFAKEMIRRGLTQRKAAEKLGLTEAAVSQYIKQKRAADVELGLGVMKMIEVAVTNVLEKNQDVFAEMYRIVKSCEDDQTMCKIHMLFEEVPKGCDVCFKKPIEVPQ